MKKILIVGGDPNSINSEIIYKSWIKLPKSIKKKIYIISNYNLLKKQFKILNYSINIIKVKSIFESEKSFDLKLINIDLRFNNPFNVSKKNASQFVLKSLNMAHKLALKKNVAGIVNCAIDKNLLIKEKIGVTEYLANKCDLKDDTYAMLIWNKKLSVCPITTHINLKEVSRIITTDKIVKTAKSTGAIISGPIPLPTKRSIYTVLRSPHVDKKSREQFQTKIHKRMIDIINSTPKTVESLMKLDLPAGVDIEIKV